MSSAYRIINALSFSLIFIGYFLFPWKINQGIALVGLGLISWAIFNLRSENIKKWLSDPLTKLILAFLLICIFQTINTPEIWSTSASDSISRYYKYIFSILAIAAMNEKHIRDACLKAFFASILLIVISMHLNIFWNLPWSNPTIKGWGNDQTVVGDYITQNLFVCLFIILSLDFFKKSINLHQKIFFSTCFFMGVHAILFLSIGRTGYVLLTSALGIYTLWAIQFKWKWPVLIVIIGSVSIALYSSQHASDRVKLAVTEANNAITDIQNNKAPELTSIGARIYMWDQTWKIISQKPIAGWGIGSYPHQWCKTVPEYWCNETAKYHPHNQYLMFWVELGIIGLFFYLAILWYLMRQGYRDKNNGGPLVALIIILIIDSLINSPLYVRREYQFFLLSIPLLYSYIRSSTKKIN